MRPHRSERWLGCILGLLLATPCWGQRALYLDLSGEWRANTEDRAEFARPDFDDRQWPTVRLPWEQRQSEIRWLRRAVAVPAGIPEVVLTLGGVGEFYKLYIDGMPKGGSAGLERGVPSLALPQQFRIALPADEGKRLQIAIRLTAFDLGGSILWRMDDRGPYLLTEPSNAPADPAGDVLARRRVLRGSAPVLGMMMWVLAVLTLLSWLSARQERHLLWLALMLVADGLRQNVSFLQVYEGSTPWDYRFFTYFVFLFTAAATAEFAMSVLGAYERWTRIAVWFLTVVSPLLNTGQRESFALIHAVLFVTIVRHTIRLSWLRDRQQAWLIPILLLLQLTQLSRIDRGGVTLSFMAGAYRWPVSVLTIVVLGLVLTFTSMRKLSADRIVKQRLARELEAARIVQKLLLRPPSVPGYEVRAVYEPAQEVGGDFYQARLLENGSLLLLVGDVSGKGLQAAMRVSLISGLFEGARGDMPAEVLAYLNQKLCGRLDGGFVTACCVLLERDGSIRAANAGHLLPYLEGEEWGLEAGLPLGVDDGAVYADSVRVLAAGRTLLLLSDGVVEAANSDGELFGFERTQAASGKPAEEIARAAKAWGQNDDITVVTVRRVPS